MWGTLPRFLLVNISSENLLTTRQLTEIKTKDTLVFYREVLAYLLIVQL
jgi:hypothetical protein